jgi:cell wall-associated NlpC family hydrolase
MTVMRVPAQLVATVGALAVLGAPTASAAPRSWAAPQIAFAISHGVFPGSPAEFRPAAPLTEGTLARVLVGLTGTAAPPPADPAAPVTVGRLDAALVRGLGLGAAAHRFYLGARAAGLDPPPRFGTEVVARLLGLRVDHPPRFETLELRPDQAATRADAAYSLARILHFAPGRSVATAALPRALAASWQVQFADDDSRSFALPPLSPWQRRILAVAVSYIGYPYVWGGTGGTTAAGFDCSGFVWRVYKLTSYAGGAALARTLRGRTTMAMSGEVPRSRRIGLARLEPGDVLFFGHGRRSKPAQVDHTGIYLGAGWFIHSSGQGVALERLDDGYDALFAWARRPLAEAGLT